MRKASCLQVIQNSEPSVVWQRQCDIRMGRCIFSRQEFVSAQQCAMNSAADVFKKPYSLAHQRVQNCRLQHS